MTPLTCLFSISQSTLSLLLISILVLNAIISPITLGPYRYIFFERTSHNQKIHVDTPCLFQVVGRNLTQLTYCLTTPKSTCCQPHSLNTVQVGRYPHRLSRLESLAGLCVGRQLLFFSIFLHQMEHWFIIIQSINCSVNPPHFLSFSSCSTNPTLRKLW